MNKHFEELLALLDLNQLNGAFISSKNTYLFDETFSYKNQLFLLTGFTGSVGAILVVNREGILFVDSRYTSQAKEEVVDFKIYTIPPEKSFEEILFSTLSNFSNVKIGIEIDRLSAKFYEKFKLKAEKNFIDLIEFKFRNCVYENDRETDFDQCQKLNITLVGENTSQKLKKVRSFYFKNKLDAFLVTNLNEIAWLTNKRGNSFINKKTFPEKVMAYTDHIEEIKGKNLHIKKTQTIGIDPESTNEFTKRIVEQFAAKLIKIKSPFNEHKSIKNYNELLHMRFAAAKTDLVMKQVQEWICEKMKDVTFLLTEAIVEEKVRDEFFRSGASSLSFKPICLSGKNTSKIHGTASERERLKIGDLFLLDIGAYYEGGYSTDITRTFLLGKDQKATAFQKKIFTAVLKGAIAGMSATFPRKTRAHFLDSVVRNPILNLGYDYNHSTGHGIGVDVHENPPTLSRFSETILEIGQIFSIEPGIYIEGFGGIRIENICTIIENPRINNFLQIVPLSFCPFDFRLIDENELNNFEKKYLAYYMREFVTDSKYFWC